MFNSNLKLKDIVIIGFVSVVLLVANQLTLRDNRLQNYGGIGFYYAALMLYRHVTLLKHDGRNGPLEDADERATSMAHKAAYKTFRYMLGFTFTVVWVPTTFVIPGPTLAVFLVGASITIYTLLELDLRLESTQEEAIHD